MHFCVPGLDFFVFINRVVSFSKLYDCTSSSLSVLFPQTDIDIEPYISVMVTSCKSPVVSCNRPNCCYWRHCTRNINYISPSGILKRSFIEVTLWTWLTCWGLLLLEGRKICFFGDDKMVVDWFTKISNSSLFLLLLIWHLSAFAVVLSRVKVWRVVCSCSSNPMILNLALPSVIIPSKYFTPDLPVFTGDKDSIAKCSVASFFISNRVNVFLEFSPPSLCSGFPSTMIYNIGASCCLQLQFIYQFW